MKKFGLSDLRNRWKTLLVICTVAAASYSIGGFANPVVIQGVASLGSSRATIPAPNLQILGTGYVGDPATGNIASVNLNATTVGGSSALMSYHIIVKVFCTMPPAAESQCASGNADAMLPGNMTPAGATSGGSTFINVPLHDPLDPSAAQPDSLSITTQAVPAPPGILGTAGGCTAGFSFGTALPAVDPNLAPIPPIMLSYKTKVTFSATVGFPDFLLYLKTTSNCGFSGSETISVTSVTPIPTPGFGVTISSAPTLASGTTNIGFEHISVPDGIGLGAYDITVTACIASTCHAVIQTVNVVAQPPF